MKEFHTLMEEHKNDFVILGVKWGKKGIDVFSADDFKEFFGYECVHPTKYIVGDEESNTIEWISMISEDGNTVTKIFDRTDLDTIPELKSGMFIKLSTGVLGYVDIDNDRIVYQDGDFDRATGELGYENWKSNKIVAVYDKDIDSFGICEFAVPIWKAKEE